MQGQSIATIDDFLEHGLHLVGHCDRAQGGCGHWGDVPLERLREKLGGGFDLYRGRWMLERVCHCSKCGNKKLTFSLDNDQARRASPGGSHGLSRTH